MRIIIYLFKKVHKPLKPSLSASQKHTIVCEDCVIYVPFVQHFIAVPIPVYQHSVGRLAVAQNLLQIKIEEYIVGFDGKQV